MRSIAFLKSTKTALTIAPLPSVALFHECSMLIKAWVVLLPGIVPNWQGSTFLRTADFTKFSITKSSVTFDKMGVKDMGRKWLFASRIGFCFGTGEILASSCMSSLKCSILVVQVDRCYRTEASSGYHRAQWPWSDKVIHWGKKCLIDNIGEDGVAHRCLPLTTVDMQ